MTPTNASETPMRSEFEHAWSEMEKKGYSYGADEIELVKLGWEMARDKLPQTQTNDANIIKRLVNRFIAWPLPASVNSDPCACMPNYPHRSGTNLLTATEAEQMMKDVFIPELYAARQEDEKLMIAGVCRIEQLERELSALRLAEKADVVMAERLRCMKIARSYANKCRTGNDDWAVSNDIEADIRRGKIPND